MDFSKIAGTAIIIGGILYTQDGRAVHFGSRSFYFGPDFENLNDFKKIKDELIEQKASKTELLHLLAIAKNESSFKISPKINPADEIGTIGGSRGAWQLTLRTMRSLAKKKIIEFDQTKWQNNNLKAQASYALALFRENEKRGASIEDSASMWNSGRPWEIAQEYARRNPLSGVKKWTIPYVPRVVKTYEKLLGKMENEKV